MNYTKEILQDKHAKITITLDKKEWEDALEKAYQQTKGKYRVQGFRPGKAPRRVIEKEYGAAVFYDDALNDSFYQYYNEVLDKEQLQVVGYPSVNVEKLDSDGVVLTATTALYPEVKLGEYKGLKIEVEKAKVTDAEVDGAIKNMLDRSARMVKVDRPAKMGDEVLIDFVGKKDGVAFNGGEAKGYQLVLGSETFIPGFEDQLVGTSAGEQKVLNVTFPENYPAKELAGAPCTFDVTVNEVREKILPELNDEFAKNVSEFDTLEEYKKSVKEDLLKEKEHQIEHQTEDKLIEAVVDNASVEIPQEMIEEEAEHYVHDLEHRLSHQGISLDDYVKYMNTTVEKLKEEGKKTADKTVKTRLVLDAIIKAEDIKLEQKDIDDAIKAQAERNGIDYEEFKKTVDEHMLGHLANDIIVDKLLTMLKKENNL